MKPFKLAIGIPSTQEWKAEMAMCLQFLTNHLQMFHHPLYALEGLRICNKRGSILPKSRNELLYEALDDGMTHLLFIDSDMRFPPDMPSKFLDKDADVVAANCPTKMLPATPTARKKGKEFYGEPVYTRRNQQPRFEKVWRVGTGLMMIRLGALKPILDKPLFEIRWSDVANQYVGEDWFFCERLEAAGIDIFVDHKVSESVSHIGDYQYDHGDVQIVLKEDEEAAA